ncbi:hypothetical protein [Massilia scottii]|uniref:hypothetical protein n=1 Tax=Massilia scottii TaxID=3057166 RepID=UPI002796BDA8|nr:hypothetical protein [Massilia sp. CCM 9029]MDQ1834943.1 hypothetical protein [Massilia sp. CCM 9029]
MIRKWIFFGVGFFVAFINTTDAKTNMKNFESPAVQFVGSWRVEAYDFREFTSPPADFDAQLRGNAASFPVGQMLKVESAGAAVMPGTYNTEKMKFDGPTGETLRVTFLTPLEKNLCKGYWEFICSGGESEYEKNFMIVEISRWDADDIKSAKMWPNVKQLNYSWVSLSKQHSFNIWVAKDGELILPIFLEGKAKDGKEFGFMGVRLKRIK